MRPVEFLKEYHRYKTYNRDAAKAERKEVNKRLKEGKAIVVKCHAIGSYALMLNNYEDYMLRMGIEDLLEKGIMDDRDINI